MTHNIEVSGSIPNWNRFELTFGCCQATSILKDLTVVIKRLSISVGKLIAL